VNDWYRYRCIGVRGRFDPIYNQYLLPDTNQLAITQASCRYTKLPCRNVESGCRWGCGGKWCRGVQQAVMRVYNTVQSLINRTVENKKHSIPPSFVPAFHVSANDCLHVLYWLFRLSLVKGFRFSSIGRNLAQYLKPCSEFDFNKYCTYWCKNNMYCFPVYTTDEILKIIHIFPNNKAPGPDNINSSLLINVWNYCISTRAYNIIFHLQQVVPVAY